MNKKNYRDFALKNVDKLMLGASLGVVAFAHLSYPHEEVIRENLVVEDKGSKKYLLDRRRSFNEAVADVLTARISSLKKRESIIKNGSGDEQIGIKECDTKVSQCLAQIENYDCTGHPNDETQKLAACNSAVQNDDSKIHCCFGMVDVMRTCYQKYVKCLSSD